MNVTQWVPANNSPRWPCVISWETLELPEGWKKHFKRSYSGSDRELVTWNAAVKEFLDSGDDWLFSCHNDVEFHPQTLIRLLSWDKPLVSALIFMRQSPVVPHIWKSYEDPTVFAMRINDTRDWFFDHKEYIKFGPQVMDPRPDDALVPVDFTSTACTLIHRSVIEKIPPPWFEMYGDAGGGEDAKFYGKARVAGFRGYVDRSCIAGHIIGDISTSAIDFMMWSQSSDYQNTGEPGVPNTDGN